MPSAWGEAWSTNWNDSWGVISGPAPPPAVVEGVIPAGGHHLWLGPYRRRHIWMDRVPGPVAEVIQVLALEQIADLQLPKRLQALQLKRELKLRDIEYHTRYFEALTLERELLVELEIAKLLRVRMDEEDLSLLVVLAATVC